MAEVTSGFHSLSSKKSPSFSNSGFTISSSSSSSSKHIYDDVFACPPSRKFKSPEFSSFGDDYYAEIFGSSKSENGVWRSTSSSIPIFNLPDSEHRRGNRGRFDYLGVFGGGGDDNLDLPDGEELFDQMKKAKTLGSASIPRSKDHTKEATTSHISRHSENGERRTRGFSQSFDSVEHFEHQIEMAPYEANGATHVVHVHANPHPPHEVGPSQKTQTNRTPIIMEDTEVRMGAYPEKEGKHSRNTSLQLGVNEQKREHDAGFQMASRLSQLNSTARSYETHQNTINAPSKQVKEGSKVQFNVNDDAGIVIPRSTSLHEGGALQKTQTNRTPTTKDSVELDIDIGLANKKAEPSRNTCLELKKGELSRSTDLEQGANEWKYDHDDSSRRASGLSDSNPTAALHDTCRINTIAGPSKMVKDDIKVEFDVQHDPIQLEPSNLVASKQNGEHDATSQKESGRNWSDQNVTSQETFEVSSVAESSKDVRVDVMTAAGPDLGKKQGRHARMASLDLGDRKQASQADAESQRNARFGSSYSFDASHDPFAARIKVQPSKVVPSSSLPQFFPVENHCKVSENSSCKNSENHMYRGSRGSPPSLDEQLDVNSVAAISAAALQRAIEEAEMRIRLAKEFLEREGQGSGKMSFKDALKRKVGKENDDVDEIYECQQNNAQHQPQVESRMQTCHHSERKTVLEADHVAPDSGGLKKSSKDEGPMEAKSAEMLKSIEEGDKHEGGEWEAAKHLNQLISGVKNRIASFMAWQAEPEKKEESKETEASRKSQPLSQGEQELKDAEVFEMKETEINEYVSASACETNYGESKTGFIPETIELAENELMQSNSVGQEKAVPKLDVVPDNEGPIRTNFLFFSFTGRRSWDCTPLEEGEDRNASGTGELGVENRKEETIEMKDEQIQGKSEEANLERLGDSCVSRHCGKSLQGSSNGESEGIPEELCSVSEYDRTKLTCEEERLNEEHGIDRRLNDECRDDRSECTHEDDHDSSLAEECDDDRSELTYQENRKMSEEFGADRNDFTYQENERLNDQCGDNESDRNHDNDRSMKEECRDDRSELTHPENRRPSEECGGNCSEFTHKEDIRLRGEHGVNRSNLTCEEGNDCRPSEKCGSDRSDFPCERINDATVYEEYGEEPISSNHCPEAVIMPIVTDDEREEYEEFENAENQLDDVELLEEADLMDKIEKRAEAIEEVNGRRENERDQGLVDDIEEVSQLMNGWEEDKRNQSQVNHAEETETRLADLVGCILANDECEQAEHGFPSDDEEPSGVDGSNSEVEEAVTSDEENEKMMEINNSSSESEMDSDVTVFPNESEMLVEETNPSSEPKKDVENSVATQEAGEAMGEERVLASFLTENTLESLGVVRFDGADGARPCENFGLHERETDLNCRQTDLRGEVLESESEEICENQTELLNESGETVDVGEAPHVSDHVGETCSFEAVHRRRRWFENNEKVSNAGRPGILEVEVDGTTLETDQEVLEESDLAGSVEIHADKLEDEALEVTVGTETSNALNQEDNRVNVEATHRRRRWFVNRGEGIPELPSLFGGIKLTPEVDPAIVNEPHPRVQLEGFVDHIHAESEDPLNVVEAEVVVNEEKSKQSVEATPRRKRWFENGDKLGPNQQQRRDEDARTTTDINQEYKETGNSEKSEEGEDDMHNKTEPSDEVHRDLDAVNRRKKERIAVERAIREARERAFAEARERARRDAVERPREGSVRVGSVGPDKPGRAPSETITAADKASMEAKLKAERAAVERATAEARERALQKALSEKASHRLREPAGRHQPERASSFDPKFHSSSSYTKCSDPSSKGEKLDGADDESAQRRKARLERQKRTMERAAKALEEKNKRDLQAQKEQAARNMLADPLDAEVKRWLSGKEGNLRALLSTLQYILGSDSGWQAISLTDLVAPTAVRKAYKKATLCVHPDKLQQRGATIQQKYICEKVFDLLKEAWSKFSPDER